MAKETIISIIIVLLILVFVWLIFIIKAKITEEDYPIKEQMEEQAEELAEEPIEEHVEEPVIKETIPEETEKTIIEITDCGTVETEKDEEKIDCWESKFKNCQPAKIIWSLGQIKYYYEIIGPDSGFCLVKSKFLENPNPEWVGKEMTCKYDNSKDFEDAIYDFIGKCSGPLYDLMTREMTGIEENENCTLASNVSKIELSTAIVSSSFIKISDFKETIKEINMHNSNPEVATASLADDGKITIKPIKTGSALLTITDTAAGPGCFLSITVIIK